MTVGHPCTYIIYNNRHICSHTRTLAQVNISMQIPYSSLNFPHATHKAMLSLCSNGCLFSSGRYVPCADRFGEVSPQLCSGCFGIRTNMYQTTMKILEFMQILFLFQIHEKCPSNMHISLYQTTTKNFELIRILFFSKS